MMYEAFFVWIDDKNILRINMSIYHLQVNESKSPPRLVKLFII